MGFFAWFRRRRTPTIRIFLDEPSRADHLLSTIQADLSREANVLVTAHFEEALVQIGQQMGVAGIEFTTRDRWTAADTKQLLTKRGGSVTAMLARSLPEVPAETPRARPADDAARVCLRVADLHVLADENDRITRFAGSLAAPTEVASSVSFDNPIMQKFAKPWVKQMMSVMGLKPGEVIDSPMVTRGVMKALSKLAARATSNAPCPSIEQWLSRNVPE